MPNTSIYLKGVSNILDDATAGHILFIPDDEPQILVDIDYFVSITNLQVESVITVLRLLRDALNVQLGTLQLPAYDTNKPLPVIICQHNAPDAQEEWTPLAIYTFWGECHVRFTKYEAPEESPE